ncbi:hypothetical protein CDAR_620321 [Caerostris darwini]|uniref:Uncharacterized protein n=1 Tax=Caerostris darwini TaxID=1538125 RepID=A0AAV4VKZ7_9ARAC|nr:hypothetical protein CDAR_620321 [Caerostris darwini]
MTDSSDSGRMEIVYKFPSRLLPRKHRKLLFRSISGGVHLIREFPTGHLITECTGAKHCLVQGYVRNSFGALPGEGGNADNFEPGREWGGGIHGDSQLRLRHDNYSDILLMSTHLLYLGFMPCLLKADRVATY